MMMKTKIRSLILRTAVILSVIPIILVLVSLLKTEDTQYDLKTVPPTCSEKGYTLYTHKENGNTYIEDIIPELGHTYSEWNVDSTKLMSVKKTHVCSVCGHSETQFEYPELQIPVLAFDGDMHGIGKSSSVNVNAAFFGDGTFTTPATLKYQGHSSLEFDKKSYTLKLYSDDSRTEKKKLTFEGWNAENKYVLKANYIDSSQCRNLICADIWADIVFSRKNVHENLAKTSNYGAVDGFPIALYINGSFNGLYTFNLHKDDDLYGMKDGCDHAVVIANTDSANEAFFRSKAVFEEGSPWEVEYCGTEDDTWVKEKLNAFITFVMESDDAMFRSRVHEYIDVESAIDYLITIYSLGLSYHGADELVLICYGKDEPWIATVYDMETAFGLSADGKSTRSPDEFLPSVTDGVWDSDTGNLLWDRMLNSFCSEIKDRYHALRGDVLVPELMISDVTAFMGKITPEIYDADDAVFAHPSPELDHLGQISNYISRRISLLDNIMK